METPPRNRQPIRNHSPKSPPGKRSHPSHLSRPSYVFLRFLPHRLRVPLRSLRELLSTVALREGGSRDTQDFCRYRKQWKLPQTPSEALDLECALPIYTIWILDLAPRKPSGLVLPRLRIMHTNYPNLKSQTSNSKSRTRSAAPPPKFFTLENPGISWNTPHFSQTIPIPAHSAPSDHPGAGGGRVARGKSAESTPPLVLGPLLSPSRSPLLGLWEGVGGGFRALSRTSLAQRRNLASLVRYPDRSSFSEVGCMSHRFLNCQRTQEKSLRPGKKRTVWKQTSRGAAP